MPVFSVEYLWEAYHRSVLTSFAFFSFLFLYFVARLNPSRVLLLCDSWNTLLPHSLLPDSVQALKILLNLIVFVYLNSHFKTLLDKLFSFLPFNELLDFNRWLFALLILLLVHAVASLNQLLVGAQQGCLPLCVHGSLVLCLPIDLMGLALRASRRFLLVVCLGNSVSVPSSSVACRLIIPNLLFDQVCKLVDIMHKRLSWLPSVGNCIRNNFVAIRTWWHRLNRLLAFLWFFVFLTVVPLVLSASCRSCSCTLLHRVIDTALGPSSLRCILCTVLSRILLGTIDFVLITNSSTAIYNFGSILVPYLLISLW